MGILSNLLGKLRGRPKAPKVKPSVGEGHRGIAAGSLKEPDISAENIEKWKILPGETGNGFVYQAEPFFVHSSNVSMLQFWIDEKKLMVEFHGGKAYIYDNVSEQEAIGFWQAFSKGGEVWNTLRVRGSRTAHRKPFRRVR